MRTVKTQSEGFQSPGMMELVGGLVSNVARVSQTRFLRFLEVRLGIFLLRGCGHPHSRRLIL